MENTIKHDSEICIDNEEYRCIDYATFPYSENTIRYDHELRVDNEGCIYHEYMELPYSDKALVEVIKELSARLKGEFTNIDMMFSRNEYYGEIGLYMVTNPFTMNDQQYLHFSQFAFEEKSWSDCVKEGQRVKRMVQRAFPNVKVKSNFRYNPYWD